MARGALLPYFEHLPSSPRPYLPATFHPARPRKALTRPVDYKHTSRRPTGYSALLFCVRLTVYCLLKVVSRASFSLLM